jgi:hypothetical protein
MGDVGIGAQYTGFSLFTINISDGFRCSEQKIIPQEAKKASETSSFMP